MTAPSRVRLAQLSSPEVAQLRERPCAVLLPVGATEQHGPHLPLDVDVRLAAAVCYAAAHAADADIAVVVAPALPFGVSEHHMAFPGTLSLDADTFTDVLVQIGRSLVRHGLDRLVIVNGHAGNTGAIQVATARLRLDAGARCVAFVSHWALGADTFAQVRDSPHGGAAHGGEFETSLYLHLDPELVDMGVAVRELSTPPIPGVPPLDLFVAAPVGLPLAHGFSRSGVLGDPTVASAEKGRVVFEAEAAALAALARDVALAEDRT